MGASYYTGKFSNLEADSETVLDFRVKTMNSGFVPQSEYDKLFKELKIERDAHLSTKSKLAVISEKLEFALGEADILKKQLKKEKEAFHQAFSHLKDTAYEQKYHTLELKQKYEEIEKVCGEQDNMLLSRETKIQNLKERLVEQKKLHQKQLDDKEIHLLQEKYIAQHCLGNHNRKEKKVEQKALNDNPYPLYNM